MAARNEHSEIKEVQHAHEQPAANNAAVAIHIGLVPVGAVRARSAAVGTACIGSAAVRARRTARAPPGGEEGFNGRGHSRSRDPHSHDGSGQPRHDIRAAGHRTRARRNSHPIAVVRQRLHPGSRLGSSPDGRAGRQIRATPHLLLRNRRVCSGLSGLRPRSDAAGAHRRPSCPRGGRRSDRDAFPRPPRRRRPSAPARTRDRRVGRSQRSRNSNGPASRGRGRLGAALVGRLLDQRSDRRPVLAARPAIPPPRRSRIERRGPARDRSRHRLCLPTDMGRRRRPRQGLDRPSDHRRLCGRRNLPGSLPSPGTLGQSPRHAFESVRRSAFLADQCGNGPLCGRRFRGNLLFKPIPPNHTRIQRVRGRAASRPMDPFAALCLSRLRRTRQTTGSSARARLWNVPSDGRTRVVRREGRGPCPLRRLRSSDDDRRAWNGIELRALGDRRPPGRFRRPTRGRLGRQFDSAPSRSGDRHSGMHGDLHGARKVPSRPAFRRRHQALSVAVRSASGDGDGLRRTLRPRRATPARRDRLGKVTPTL